MNKKGGFKPFWIIFGILGILLIGSFITPSKIVLDDIFYRLNNDAIANGDPSNPGTLACTDTDASPIKKATCFTMGGFVVMFIFYILYSWITGMYNGAKSRTPIFAPRHKQLQEALEA